MKSPLIIRDGHAVINGDKSEHEMPSGSLEIVDADGRALFSLALEGCELRVSTHSRVKYNKQVYSETICVKPKVSNVVNICRIPEAT